MTDDREQHSGDIRQADGEGSRSSDVHPREISSIITGDRLCTRCGYNLVGQSVVRESNYQLLIVRCPECGTVTAVQEYPLLGPWGKRWGAIAAVVYCVFLLGMYFASAGIIYGWSTVSANEASWEYQRLIETEYNAYVIREQEAKRTAATGAGGGGAPAGAAEGQATTAGVAEGQATRASLPGAGDPVIITGTTIDPRTGVTMTSFAPPASFANAQADFATWWSQQDTAAMFEEAGGWRQVFDGDARWVLIPASIFAAAIGWFWSIALLQLRRRWVFIFALFILAMAGLFGAIMIAELMTQDPSWSGRAAERQVVPPALMLSIIASAIPLGLAIWLGRPGARLIVRALLPPGVRDSLSLLWTAEGLVPPRARQESRRG